MGGAAAGTGDATAAMTGVEAGAGTIAETGGAKIETGDDGKPTGKYKSHRVYLQFYEVYQEKKKKKKFRPKSKYCILPSFIDNLVVKSTCLIVVLSTSNIQ